MIYRFRITFEDYDDVVREVEVKPTQTFLDLHNAFLQHIAFKADYPSSFYISNDQWIKGKEITFSPNNRQKEAKVAEMAKSRLCDFIDDPHQKFYYVFDFDKPWTFLVELVSIGDEKKNTVYPYVIKKSGEAPKQFGIKGVPLVPSPHHDDPLLAAFEEEPEEEDIHESEQLGYDEGDGEDMEIDNKEDEEESKEDDYNMSDDIADEFSNNEGGEDTYRDDY